ncbi:MAG: pitrilysin family protein [Woeseiaceae bacterium]|nr:pitrilysin family protein [Woeseiaceae bacterium]
MIKRLAASTLLAALLVLPAAAQDLAGVDIPYERHILDNGLTVLVHVDRAAPQAFVNVYYKVGSRDEKPGKTGFAHLFEHLMFNGSENYDGEYFEPVQDVGGSLNGDTWFDRTRYFQTVPNTALDRILWLESDRMGHLLGAVTQEKLDQQRGVVQNEKRRGDNRPYSQVYKKMLAGVYPKGHPYSWSTIGSMEDLDAASLEDVHEWFKEWYGAANAIVTVAGDIDPVAALASVEAHFGDIPAGPPVSHRDDWVPERTLNTFETYQDRVANPLIYRGWSVPGLDHEASTLVSLATRILGGDSSSRLYRRLVKEEKLAVGASMSTQPFDLASMVGLQVVLIPGADADRVRQIVAEELSRFFRDGPTLKELELIKTQYAASVIKGLDSLAGKANLLAESEYYGGSPDAYKLGFSWIDNSTPESVRAAAVEWLGDGFHEIYVTMFPNYTAAAEGVDRSDLPSVDSYPPAKGPEVEDFELKNGIPVRFVKRAGVPAVSVVGLFRIGSVVSANENPAASAIAFPAMSRGTKERSADEIQDDLKRTGSSFSMSLDNDSSRMTVSTLTSKIDDAMELAADIVRNPSFDEKEVALLKEQSIATIEQGKTNPATLARMYSDAVIYGEHPYGGMPSTTADVAALTDADIRAAYERRIRPQDLTLYVVGGIESEELRSTLNKHFGNWKPVKGESLDVDVLAAPQPEPQPRVIVFDMPGAPQSNIVAARVIDPPFQAGHTEFTLANMIYGGNFMSRINTNLREERGWSYGVRSGTGQTAGPRKWWIIAQVQSDKTADSIRELVAEFEALADARPITADELDKVRNERIRKLPAVTATANGTLQYLVNNGVFGLADDYVEQRKAEYEAVQLEDLVASLTDRIDPDELTWFVTGDLEKIEDSINALEIGEVEVWDADGNRLR